jgi:hypothetical protein
LRSSIGTSYSSAGVLVLSYILFDFAFLLFNCLEP